MNINKKFFIAYVVLILSLGLSSTILAAPQEISAEGEYHLGDRDTREDAKFAALADAKRKISEQAGVYVESYTEVNNYQLTSSQIKTIASALIKIKSESVNFYENGTLCKAYVVAIIDTDNIGKLNIDKTNRSSTSRVEKPKESGTSSGSNKIKNFIDGIFGNKSNATVDFNDLEVARSSMINNLSKATAFTAASEYKLQEVTGMTKLGYYDEKGNIANSLQEKPEMQKNYRFAELSSFVNEAGATKIMNILNEKNQQHDNSAKERLTWAKNDRAKAKKHKDCALKEAMALLKKINKLISKATVDSNDRNWLQTLKTEADDTVKLAKALDLRNKEIDNVVKNYEKLNKIVIKS